MINYRISHIREKIISEAVGHRLLTQPNRNEIQMFKKNVCDVCIKHQFDKIEQLFVILNIAIDENIEEKIKNAKRKIEHSKEIQ
jgi:hypothetical protein